MLLYISFKPAGVGRHQGCVCPVFVFSTASDWIQGSADTPVLLFFTFRLSSLSPSTLYVYELKYISFQSAVDRD